MRSFRHQPGDPQGEAHDHLLSDDHSDESGSESDDDHSHHHDEHSKHHHHHQEYKTAAGNTVSFNIFHHDPDHGSGKNHYHRATVYDKGKPVEVLVIHQGEEHKDEQPGTHLASLVNGTPIVYPEKPVQIIPASVFETEAKQANSTNKPSAPPRGNLLRPPVGYSPRLYSYNPHAARHLEVVREEDCCCLVM